MCGRFNQASDPQTWVKHFSQVLGEIKLEQSLEAPNFNVAPTDEMSMLVRDKEDTLSIRTAKWGLVPSWAKDTKAAARLINARVETVLEKPAFRTSFAKRRCIIPVDNFYDWHKVGDTKQPYGIWGKDMAPLMLAGLYSFWRQDEGSEWHVSSTILTTEPNKEMSEIHHRMPVVLDTDAWQTWLDNEAEPGELIDLTYQNDDVLELRKVSTAINSARSKGPEALQILD